MPNTLVPIVLAVWVVAVVVIVWATFDAALRPTEVWAAAGQEKLVWILVILFLPLFGAAGYLIAVRPQLKQAQPR